MQICHFLDRSEHIMLSSNNSSHTIFSKLPLAWNGQVERLRCARRLVKVPCHITTQQHKCFLYITENISYTLIPFCWRWKEKYYTYIRIGEFFFFHAIYKMSIGHPLAVFDDFARVRFKVSTSNRSRVRVRKSAATNVWEETVFHDGTPRTAQTNCRGSLQDHRTGSAREPRLMYK